MTWWLLQTYKKIWRDSVQEMIGKFLYCAGFLFQLIGYIMLYTGYLRLPVIMVAWKTFEYLLFLFKALISEIITVSGVGLVYVSLLFSK